MIAPAVSNYRLEAALSYARGGRKVLPLHYPKVGPSRTVCSCEKAEKCSSPAKHPLTLNGLKDATADEATILAWWEKWPAANVGILTGADSGIVVLDVDTRDGGAEGMETLRAVHGDLPDTVQAVTGGGGAHWIFLHPGKSVRNSSRKIGKGLDVRGDGGYIVAPPSRHASGGTYGWLSGFSPDDVDPLPLPAWLLGLMLEKDKPAQSRFTDSISDTCRFWLGKALAKVNNGTRNDDGLWLCCQLRDAGISLDEASPVIIEYQARCPQGDEPYTQIEALRTLESTYTQAAREPAKSRNGSPLASKPVQVKIDRPEESASGELKRFLGDIASGKLINVPFYDWPVLTYLTQALVPGTLTMVVGDPGVGKTFWVLQNLKHWVANGHMPAVLFIEKDRKFHTHRLLAQLESCGRFIDWDWVKQNAAEVESAVERHAGMIDAMGEHIWSQPRERLTLGGVGEWIRERCEQGCRVIVVDPITAADAGDKRWLADDEFVHGVQRTLCEYAASLILITHPKGNFTPKQRSGYGQGGGTAYLKFSDTDIWIARNKKPRKVELKRNKNDVPWKTKLDTFAEIHKARLGKGTNIEVGFMWHQMKFAEQGMVIRDIRSGSEQEDEASA